MDKGNVLVVGYAGVGKSTLIKAILGDTAMKKPIPSKAKTDTDFKIYENKSIPFRLIDTVGIEPGVFKERKAVSALRKWSGDTIKAGKDNQISVIWFCLDRLTAQLFPKTIEAFMDSVSVWKNVPIVVVITQSYNADDVNETEAIVEKAFLSKKKYATRLVDVVSVVAKPKTAEEGELIVPMGITELIELTNSLLPEGLQAAEKDIARYNLTRKRAMSHAVVSVATLTGITVGSVASRVVDVMLLKPTESLEIESIFKIWGIKKTKKAKEMLKLMVDIGTVSITGKMIASTLKVIPGVNIGAAVVNGFISGAIVFALGEASAFVFEQIYSGKKTLDDLDWVKDVLDEKLTSSALDKVTSTVADVSKNADKKEILNMVVSAFGKKALA